MSGHTNFRVLQEQHDERLANDPAGQARLQQERQLTRTIIELTKLREARGATQQQIANAWEATQANVSQIEHTPDIFLSTLQKYVEALGGRVEIRAVFPDQTVTLTADVDRAAAGPPDEPDAPHTALTG